MKIDKQSFFYTQYYFMRREKKNNNNYFRCQHIYVQIGSNWSLYVIPFMFLYRSSKQEKKYKRELD